MPESRIKIAPDGSFRLSEEILERLGWKTGTYLEASVDGDALRLKRIEVDLFAEALRKPDPESFEKMLAKQKKSQEDAFEAFEEKMKQKNLPGARPEDRPDYWR